MIFFSIPFVCLFVFAEITVLITVMIQSFVIFLVNIENYSHFLFIYLLFGCTIPCGCENLISCPGRKPRPLTVKVRSPNHWITREVPRKWNIYWRKLKNITGHKLAYKCIPWTSIRRLNIIKYECPLIYKFNKINKVTNDIWWKRIWN